MSALRTNAAAVMLGVSPNTLRCWERRYGFPCPDRTAGGHRQYALDEIEALKQTLAETHNVSSAIALAHERGAGPSSPIRLAAAFAAFDEQEANRLLEDSLALRSYERTIEEVLLAAVASHAGNDGATAEYEFAWRHATGWLSALRRLAPPASRPESVLVLDASVPCDLDGVHAQALELVLRRAGLRTLSLSPAVDPPRLGRALRALDPGALVLTGRRFTLDSVGRLVYTIRAILQEITVFDYRGAVPHARAGTVCRLGQTPIKARDRLLERLELPVLQSAAHVVPAPTGRPARVIP